MVANVDIPEPMKEQAALLTGCVSGADHVDNIEADLREFGFENVKIEIRPEVTIHTPEVKGVDKSYFLRDKSDHI